MKRLVVDTLSRLWNDELFAKRYLRGLIGGGGAAMALFAEKLADAGASPRVIFWAKIVGAGFLGLSLLINLGDKNPEPPAAQP